MLTLQKNYLSPGSARAQGFRRFTHCVFLLLHSHMNYGQQIANYVSNGSFEETYNNCVGPADLKTATFWNSIDSVSFGGAYFSYCNSTVPLSANAYQFPVSGSAYIGSTYFWSNGFRSYPKNRLKKTLQSGKIYCVKFYVNITNKSPYGVDGFGAYFGNAATIDTIKKCVIPLTYLNPQIKNPLGNVIKDTLNWIPIVGTFTANGTEKYLVLGNFLSQNAVTTSSIGGPYFPQVWTDVFMDDVTCIEVDVGAYAGPDKSILNGDSVYLGRESDFAVDPFCYWYKLPGMSPIDTTSGIYVKPSVTSTYVVRQELECNSIKWDTVVVHVGYTGFKELTANGEGLIVFPNPADDILNIEFSETDGQRAVCRYQIVNSLGQMIREEELSFGDRVGKIKTDDLPEGVYVFRWATEQFRFVVRH